LTNKELAACLASGLVLGIASGYFFTIVMELFK